MDEGLLREIETCQRCASVSADPYIPGYSHRRRNAEAAYRWRPVEVKLLLVGESPPRSGEYFYTHVAPLFKAIAEALCPDLAATPKYSLDQIAILSSLREDGVFLIDAAKCAVNYRGELNQFEREECMSRCSEYFVRELEALEPKAIVPALKAVRWALRDALGGTKWAGAVVWWPELPFPNFPERRQTFIQDLRQIAISRCVARE